MGKYKDIDKKLFTELKYHLIENKIFTYAESLSLMRGFKKDILNNRGIFYSKSPIDTLKEYPFLRESSIISNKNLLYIDTYIYPICNTKGEVLLHMGYTNTPTTSQHKYEISNSININQKNIIANLESLSLYDGEYIFVTEGYFDAIAINNTYSLKSIAILGSSKLTVPKRTILKELKNKGHKLIYLPDNDVSGEIVVNEPIWDYVIYYTSDDSIKDFNDYIVYMNNNNLDVINLQEEVSKKFLCNNYSPNVFTNFGYK